jgi:hypothetical protein
MKAKTKKTEPIIDTKILSDIVDKLHITDEEEQELLKRITPLPLPETASVIIPEKTEEEKAREAEILSRPFFPKALPEFIFTFESGLVTPVPYVVLAKTYEEAIEKIRVALNITDLSHLKFKSMTQKEIANTIEKK